MRKIASKSLTANADHKSYSKSGGYILIYTPHLGGKMAADDGGLHGSANESNLGSR